MLSVDFVKLTQDTISIVKSFLFIIVTTGNGIYLDAVGENRITLNTILANDQYFGRIFGVVQFRQNYTIENNEDKITC